MTGRSSDSCFDAESALFPGGDCDLEDCCDWSGWREEEEVM